MKRRRVVRLAVLLAIIMPLGLMAPSEAKVSFCSDQGDWCDYCQTGGCFYFMHDNCEFCIGEFCCSKPDYQKGVPPSGC